MAFISASNGAGFRATGMVKSGTFPIGAAAAEAAISNPLNPPAGAIGMVVRPAASMVVGDVGELSQEIAETKGNGYLIRGTDPSQVLYFSNVVNENWHLHYVSGVTIFLLEVYFIF